MLLNVKVDSASYNVKQQNAHLLNKYFNFYDVFYMFRTQGSSSGKRMYV